MSINPSNFDPRFLVAMNDLANIPDSEIETHPGVPKLIATMIALAPPELKPTLIEGAKEYGIIPDQPIGYTEDGEPMYSTQQIAECLGIPVDEVNRIAIEDLGINPDDQPTVHRRQ